LIRCDVLKTTLLVFSTISSLLLCTDEQITTKVSFDHLPTQVLKLASYEKKAKRKQEQHSKTAEGSAAALTAIATSTVPDSSRWHSWSSDEWSLILFVVRQKCLEKNLIVDVSVTSNKIEKVLCGLALLRPLAAVAWTPSPGPHPYFACFFLPFFC
jgi:hypothetical protein